MVGVQDLTRARMDADEGSAARRGSSSLDEVIDEVIDGHDDSRVVDFGDRGCAATDVGDLLKELFSSESEVTADRFWDRLRVEQRDREDWGSGIDRMDFIAVAANEGVLFRELLERGREGDPEDLAHLGDHGCVLHGHLRVRLRVRDGSSLDGDLLCKAAFGGST
jgi:hypothetical protein